MIGFVPGTDRKLPPWSQVVAYFTALSKSSPRIQLHSLGKTTLGRPFIAAIISDSATIANLPKYREIQRRLADPRVRRPGERDSLIADGKLIVLITSSIHSDEVGGILTPLVLAHRLVSGEDAETKAIRAQTIVLMVPSLNPDGVDIVGDWYRSTLGTPAEGTDVPVLYHHYTGHDNNRDWYAFTQVETQMTVDSLHNLWHPQIVNDIHQQGTDEARLFIPPYMDPIEPNVDPILISGVNALGLDMTWRLMAQGKTGITNNSTYDAWTPSRAYMHYHGGARILTETASAAIASPLTTPFDSLQPGRGYDSKVSSWNFLVPWQGGTWTIGNIVDYQVSASWALLQAAAPMRTTWLENFSRVSERAVQGQRAAGREKWPAAYLIPMQQPDQASLRTVLRILQRGQVEIRRATAPFVANRVRFSAGTYVVLLDQPYGAFAKALLENQHYPDLHEYPGGPPKAPYDVTAQTLPLLMGVGAVAVDSFPVTMTEPIAQIAPPKLEVPGLSGSASRRIAIYRSWNPSMDEGWTRFVFDQYHIPFTSIGDREVRAGNLAARFDAIILPDESPRGLQTGPREAAYPDSLKGGLGAAGDAALHDFVERWRHTHHLQRRESLGDRISEAAGEGRARRCEREGLLRAGLVVRGEHGPVASAQSPDARAPGGVVRGWTGVRDHRHHARDGGCGVRVHGIGAALRMAPRRREAARTRGARGCEGREGARGALRLSAAVSRAEHGDVSAALGGAVGAVTAWSSAPATF